MSAPSTDWLDTATPVDLRERLRVALRVAAEQAADDGLWFKAQTASEAHLQAALRRLAAAIEGTI